MLHCKKCLKIFFPRYVEKKFPKIFLKIQHFYVENYLTLLGFENALKYLQNPTFEKEKLFNTFEICKFSKIL